MRTTRKHRSPLRFAIIAFAAASWNFSLPSVADAATSEEVESTLELLGVTDPPEPLIERVRSLIGDDRTEPVDEPGVSERIRARVRLWRDVAPEWREVERGLMIRVRECRDGTADGDCGDQLRNELRLRHAERLMERIEQRLAEAQQLPAESRQERIAALELIMERARIRLETMAQLSDRELGDLASSRTLMNQLRERIQMEAGR